MMKKLTICVVILLLIIFSLLCYKFVVLPWSLSKIEMTESKSDDVTRIELYLVEDRDLFGTATIFDTKMIEQIMEMLVSYKVDKKVRYPQDNVYGETGYALKIDIHCEEEATESFYVNGYTVLKERFKEGYEWVYEVLISYIPEDFYPKLRAIYDANVIAP